MATIPVSAVSNEQRPVDSSSRRAFLSSAGRGGVALLLPTVLTACRDQIDSPTATAPKGESLAALRDLDLPACSSTTGAYAAGPFSVVSGAVLVGRPAPGVPHALQVAGINLRTARLITATHLLSTTEFLVVSPTELLRRLVGPGRTLDLPFPTTDDRYPFAAAIVAARALGVVRWTPSQIPLLFEDPFSPSLTFPVQDDEELDANLEIGGLIITTDKEYSYKVKITGSYRSNKNDPAVDLLRAIRALLLEQPCPDTPAIEVNIAIDVFISCLNRQADADGKRQGWSHNLKFQLKGRVKVASRFCDLANAALGR